MQITLIQENGFGIEPQAEQDQINIFGNRGSRRLHENFTETDYVFFVVSSSQSFASGTHDFSFIDEDGERHSLARYKGKFLVVMNTVPECGYRV